MKKRLLLIDNDSHEREIKKVQFGLICDIDTAKSVKEAKHYLLSKDYDYVITDIMLPIETGIDLAEFMKERYPKTPVIFATAHHDLEDIKIPNVLATILKPYNPEDFFDLVTPRWAA